MKKCILGLILFIAGFTFGLAETFYFGNHLLPHSWAEVAYDSLAFVLIMVGASLIRSKS